MTALMRVLSGLMFFIVTGLLICMPSLAQDAGKPITIRKVELLGGTSSMEVEISADGRIAAQGQAIADPDRLVIDIPNAVPSSTIHKLTLGRGDVKGVRIGLFSSNPPVTRVVIDLTGPKGFQIFPSGNTAIVKLQPGPPKTAFTTEFDVVPDEETVPAEVTPPPPGPKVDVEFQNGLLSIVANKATLAEVFDEIHRKTGAQITIPPAAQQEQVVANIPPGPARDVLATLLNGSAFNFVMIGSDSQPGQLRSVILSPKGAPMNVPNGSTPQQIPQGR
jgi:hypothetical protein